MLKQIRVPELMDDPLLDPALHGAALRDLTKLNILSGSAQLIAAPVMRLARARRRKGEVGPLKVLDVASGAGDMAIALQKLCQQSGYDVTVHGLDFSQVAVQQASTDGQKALANCTFACHDVLKDPLPEGFDVIVTSLFTHHLDSEQVKKLLAEMKSKAKRLVLVNDLRRSHTSLFFVKMACELFTKSPIVRYDGPVSVKAAYTAAEMRSMALAAGLTGVRVTEHWPCRFLLEWENKR